MAKSSHRSVKRLSGSPRPLSISGSTWQNPILLVALTALILSGCQPLMVKAPHPSTIHRAYASHLSESGRSNIQRVAVVAGNAEVNFAVGGADYGKQGDEVGKGMAEGVGAAFSGLGESGEGAALYILLLPVIIPVAAGVGGVAGAVEAERRENNKQAADALIAAYDGQLPNVLLAREIEKQILEVKGLEARVYPDTAIDGIDADAMLTVNVTEVTADINGSQGRLGVSVEAALVSLPDREPLYRELYGFHDTRSMSDWAEDNGKAWLEHLRRAKIRISERIVQNHFTLLELRHVLRPVATASYTDFEDATLNSKTPELSWDFLLLGDDSHLLAQPPIDSESITWDIRIQHGDDIAYERRELPSQTHVVEDGLKECSAYTWSVRPRFNLDGHVRLGEWMVVSQASRGDVVNLWDDFHPLHTPCSSSQKDQS
jgi:hypothetical protein